MHLKLHGLLSEYLFKIRTGVALVTLTLLMALSLLPTLLLQGMYTADKDNSTGASRLHGDGVYPEVLRHIEKGLEPQMWNPTIDPSLSVMNAGAWPYPGS